MMAGSGGWGYLRCLNMYRVLGCSSSIIVYYVCCRCMSIQYCEAQARVRQGSARIGKGWQGKGQARIGKDRQGMALKAKGLMALTPCLELTLKLVATTTTTTHHHHPKVSFYLTNGQAVNR